MQNPRKTAPERDLTQQQAHPRSMQMDLYGFVAEDVDNMPEALPSVLEQIKAWTHQGVAVSDTAKTYAATQATWLAHGRVIVRLAPDLVDLLMEIDLPEAAEELPKMPWACFWLDKAMAAPDDPATALEGLYARSDGDVVRLAALYLSEDAIALGEASVAVGTSFPDAQDSIWKLVWNLLLLWDAQKSPIRLRSVQPSVPRSPKKQKRLESAGRSDAKYWSLTLDPAFQIATKAPPTDWNGPMHLATVRGHYRTVWVVDPESSSVLSTKPCHLQSDRVLYRVRRFIAPHRAWRRGEQPAHNTYIVT